MASVPVTFYRIIQASQEYATGDEHMISRIFFRAQAKGKTYEGFADLKQLVGSSFETPGSIEVSVPAEYLGPKFDYSAFSAAAADCFKSQIGSSGKGIHISGGANVRMHNNIFEFNKTFQIETHEDNPPSW